MKNYFAENLKRLRKQKKLTQEELAIQTNLTRNTIALYETNKRHCDFDTLLLLSEFFDCTTDELLKNPNDIERTKGYIYILTNPSFPAYVKIGYADDVKERLQHFNRSVCVPFSFRVYATYAVNSRLSDKQLHAIIDKLNPELRAIEVENGKKKREREFYAMAPEDAYELLEAIAEIHNYSHRLCKVPLNETEKKEEKEAKKIETENKTRSSNFTFSEWKIPVGAILTYKKDESVVCKVVDDRKVEYNGQIMSLTGVAKQLLGKQRGVCGPHFFTYKKAKLWDIENRVE
ncbi:MAG: GIY-YIG nuclease family protein [Clostridia bacterium]|nr:GIY-YIG nuclease family protein [Clostridia bacterium]